MHTSPSISGRGALCFASWLVLSAAASAAGPDFDREVRPILVEHCGHCHGADEKTRQGSLRLDVREVALAGGDSGQPAIVPGKPAASEVVARIRATDPDVIMPPPHEQKPLTQAQMATLEAWIAAGGDYAKHWSFVAPVKAPVPPLPGGGAAANAIDGFVRARLAAQGIAPAAPADAATLCRRLHLDITGLPPTPEDLAAFARDGYEKTVDRLLASDRFGEKWARPWLDVARYADSNGYEKDLRRDMWAWRDWVIAAFNRDMPYDQFVIEQLAGDLLPDATQEQIVATGFLRNSMLNEEGAVIPEEFRMVEMFDRVDCLGKAVVGLTTGCAQCHSHKFDPLTQDEYFGLFAFLNNSYEPRSNVYAPDKLAELAEMKKQSAAADEKIRQQRPNWAAELAAWERQLAAPPATWTPVAMDEMSSDGLLTHPVQLEDKSILMLGHRDKTMILEATPDLAGVTAVQLEALNHGDLFLSGPGRDGPWQLAELKVELKRPGAGQWEPVKLVKASADFSSPEDAWSKPGSADGKQPERKLSSGPVAKLIDGDESTAWSADRGPLVRHQPSVAVVEFEKPLDAPEGTRLRVSVQNGEGRDFPGNFNTEQSNVIGCVRVSLTTSPAPAAPPVPHGAILALRKPARDRTPEEQAAIFAGWRQAVPELAAVNAEIDAIWRRPPEPLTSIFHLAERPADKARPTFLLDRGVWNQPTKQVEPHVPAAFHPFPEAAPKNRLGFARWLVDRKSPLAARVEANRIWQVIFGTGLVETSDDLGTRAPVPEYRELLDWLAVDFMDEGWSRKRLIRTIVTSDTYKQSSRATAEQMAADPTNRLLARGPRFRVDAEVVRDIALAASGLISERMGGPGVIPPVPQNVLDYNYVYPTFWTPATGPERYRRSVYLFRKRSMPDPVMSSFDAPNGDLSCARRVRSNTPLAALAALNEPVFVEAAQALAARTLREGGADDASRAGRAFLLCTSRLPTDDERRELVAFVAAQRKRLADGWVDPRIVATGDAARLPSLPPGTTPQDAAAWTLASRVLLNLDETITKN